MAMVGPTILARAMTTATSRGIGAHSWQYHSRSDTHSKIACWTVLFDLLIECDVLKQHAVEERIAFGINHEMVGPINKTLDLVVLAVQPNRTGAKRATFAEVGSKYGISLSDTEKAILGDLPVVHQDASDDISEVAIALEAKACMTAHLKSMPRLHAEILATGYLAKRAAPRCISVSYSLVNTADTFLSPGKAIANRHKQPEDARRVVQMLSTAIPLAREGNGYGYDVIGVTTIDCKNDGSPVTLSTSNPAAPTTGDHFHYERMIRSICAEYRARFYRSGA